MKEHDPDQILDILAKGTAILKKSRDIGHEVDEIHREIFQFNVRWYHALYDIQIRSYREKIAQLTKETKIEVAKLQFFLQNEDSDLRHFATLAHANLVIAQHACVNSHLILNNMKTRSTYQFCVLMCAISLFFSLISIVTIG